MCWCIANIYLPETAGSSRRLSECFAQEESCVYICDYRFDLSPYAGPFVIQTKGGTLQVLWHYKTHLMSKEGGSWLLKAPCHFGGHMFSIENSLLPSRHISVSLWFKPESKEGIALFHSYFPFFENPSSWNDLHQQEILSLFSVGYLYSFPKGIYKVILHFIVTNGPRKLDMWDVGGLAMMALYRACWVYIFIPTRSKLARFQIGLGFHRPLHSTICPSIRIRQALIISKFDTFDNVSMLRCDVMDLALQMYPFHSPVILFCSPLSDS